LTADDDPLPTPGSPFEVADEIALFPVQISSRDDPGWLGRDYAGIDDINERAETFGFHFVSDPGTRRAQGMENIVGRTPSYYAWRAAYEAALAAAGDPKVAMRETQGLARRVVAEHPIYGHDLRRDR